MQSNLQVKTSLRMLLTGLAFIATVVVLISIIALMSCRFPVMTGTYWHMLVGASLAQEVVEMLWPTHIILFGLTTMFMVILVAFFIAFLRNYEWTTFVVTFMALAICLPIYTFVYEYFFGTPIGPELFFLGVVCAITGIIAWAVPLGRGRLLHTTIFYILFTLFYILNEFLLFRYWGAHDPGGSLLVHAFAAYFGMGWILRGLHTKPEDYKVPMEMTKLTMTICLMGAGLLWAWWPNFVAALMGPVLYATGAFNTVFAICGSTISAIIVSRLWRGKPGIVDICWSMLAGGVAIGSVADLTTIWEAFIIGLIAGAITATGLAKVWDSFNKKIGIDVCGVQFLHGWSGIFGGLVAAIIIVGMRAPELWPLGPISQIMGVITTVIIGIIGGAITGLICLPIKRPEPLYSDKPILVEAETITE